MATEEIIELQEVHNTIQIIEYPQPSVIEVSDPQLVAKGDSAYRVAVKNGFTGTEAEWLESLKPDYTGKRIALSGKNVEVLVPDNKYFSVHVVDGDENEVSVCLNISSGKITISSLVPLDGHTLILRG